MSFTNVFDIPSSDLGGGAPVIAWHSSLGLLAAIGSNGNAVICDKQGKKLHELSHNGATKAEWADPEPILALLCEGSVLLYHHKSKKTETIDMGVKRLVSLRWSSYGTDIAVGSMDGTVAIYNFASQQAIPIQDIHSQIVVDLVWTSMESYLVSVGADNVISMSDVEGNVLSTITIPGEKKPDSIFLIESINSMGNGGDSWHVVVNKLWELQVVNLDTKAVFTSQFSQDLGNIECIANGMDGTIAIGFVSGVVGVATIDSVGIQLIQQIQPFSDRVNSISVGKVNSLYACLSHNVVKVFARSPETFLELPDYEIQFESQYQKVLKAIWSPDEQHVTAVTVGGYVSSHGISFKTMSTMSGNLVFYYVSSNMINVKSLKDNAVICTLSVDVEPLRMSAGMGVLALATDSRVYYYAYSAPESGSLEGSVPGTDGNPKLPQKKLITSMEYPSPIADVKVSSEYASVLVDGRAQLHSIHDPESDSLMLPPGRDSKIIAIGLSENFFIYITGLKVSVLTVKNKQVVAEYTSRVPLKRAFPNPSCTRVVLITEADSLQVLNPITEVASPAEGFKADHRNILWDMADSTVFVSYDQTEFVTFICSSHSRHGPTCESVLVRDTPNDNLVTEIPMDCIPIGLHRGVVIGQHSASGVLESIPLKTHAQTTLRVANPEAFYNNFSLNRLRWSSQNISTPQEAEDLAVKALHMLDIELAIRVYRQLSQPSMVLCLEKIKHIHEKNLLIGHVSMIMGYIKDAQNFFLRSSQPLCALEMRRDLMQWEPALLLAKDLAPDQVPIISKEYAQQLEYRGEYAKALEMYKNGAHEVPKGHASAELTAAQEEVKEHNQQCLEGTARCLIHTGSIKEGVEIALSSKNHEFTAVCANLCEESQNFNEAAQLYEKSGDAERAAALYIEKSKNLKAAGRLLPLLKSRNIIGIYAAAKEREGAFKEAEEAYAKGEDWENCVRLKVQKLNDLAGAFTIVRRTKSADAAALVANMCKKNGEFGAAVEFLVLAGNTSEAFELAEEHNVMFHFESALLKQIPLKDGVAPIAHQSKFAVIASHYDKEGRHGQAGLFYTIAGNFSMALKKYMEAGEPEDIDKAVEVVGKARSESLTSKLIDYLMGETDGEAKEPTYIFKLYMSLGSFEKAAKTSVIIALKEQEMGNYRLAHKTLVEATRLLYDKKIRVPNDLRRCFMILHSYIVVKDLIKVLQDEATATRMLLRVSKNIQKFPKHISEILVATVSQCVKTGFKKSAFDFACSVVQNEKYRTALPEKDRKKIEGIVRKSGKDDLIDPVEPALPCPFCDAPVPETELDCGGCKNMLPFCIVTGKHIVKSEFGLTPCCKLPFIYSAMALRLKTCSTCPGCNGLLDLNKIERESDFDFRTLQ